MLQADCGGYGLNVCITVLWVSEFFCNTDADQVTTQLSTFLKHTHRAPGLVLQRIHLNEVGYIFKNKMAQIVTLNTAALEIEIPPFG